MFGSERHNGGAIRRGAQLLAGRRSRTVAVLAAGAVLLPAVTAQATTGADALNKAPIFKVSKAQAAPFIGGYTLAGSGGSKSTGVIGSTLRTGYNTEGYLMGTISVTKYSGNTPGTFVAALYEYRRKGANMLVDLWTPDLGSDRLGLLTVHRSGTDLTGTLKIGSVTSNVTYKPVSSDTAGNTVSGAALSSDTTQQLTTNAGIFSTAVVLAESIRG